MNDDGQVVGLLSGSCTGCDVGFLASDGVAGIAWSGTVHDVNDSWELVGTASGPRGILMINGTAYYLDDLLDSSGAGWTIRDARQITEDGTIVGGAQDSSGNLHAVLLVPERPRSSSITQVRACGQPSCVAVSTNWYWRRRLS